ncbi:MAG: ribosome maturation factor RimM [Betaproteobacteria bacterium]|nr:ribosome maturation factor RimM [Betaproteobacteria bacterium]
MGRVLAPFGVKGWLKIEPWSERPKQLLDHSVWWLGRNGDWQSIKIAQSAQHGACLIARLEGCGDRDQALAWRGCEVALPRQALPEAAKDEYYQADLIGLVVVNLRGERLGRVAGLFSNGAHDVVRIMPDPVPGAAAKAAEERLVPWIATVVCHVDVAGRQIEVDWELDW